MPRKNEQIAPVRRDSEPVQAPEVRPGDIAVQGTGRVSPKASTGVFSQQVGTKHGKFTAAPTGELDPILKSLFGVGLKITEQLAEQEQQNAYLDGVLAATAGVNETELQSGWLTKDWTVAGYRDTVGRLALADYDVDVRKSIDTMKERSPEEMARYLRDKRKDLMPILQKMSLQSRSEIIPKIAAAENAFMVEHAKARQEYIFDQHVTGIRNELGTKVSALLSTSGSSDPRWESAANDLFTQMLTTVYQNPNLPPETKSSMLKEITELTMNAGDLSIYQRLTQVEFQDDDGNPYTLASTMEFKDVAALASKYQPTMAKNQLRNSDGWYNQHLQYKWDIETGNPPDPAEYAAFLAKGEINGNLTSKERESAILKLAPSIKSQRRSSQIVHAVDQGDHHTLTTLLGSNSKQGSKAYVDAAFENYDNLSLDDKHRTFIKVMDTSIRKGFPEIMTEIGERYVTPAIRAIQSSENSEVDAETGNILTSFSEQYSISKANGKVNETSSMLSGLPDDVSAWFSMYAENAKSTHSEDPNAIASKTNEQFQTFTDKTDSYKSLEAQRKKNAVEKDIESFSPQGIFGTVATEVYAFFNNDRANVEKVLTETKFPFASNPEAYNEVATEVKSAILIEANSILARRPYLDPSDIVTKAASEVAKRAIPHEGGILVMPSDNINGLLGAKSGVNKSYIGDSISALVHDHIEEIGADTPSRFSTVFTSSGEGGTLRVNVYNDRGEVSSNFSIDAKDIGRKADELFTESNKHDNHVYGTGIQHKDTRTGVSVWFNGDNTVGLDNELAYNIRNSILEYESVKDTLFDDPASGKNIGVSINETNEFFPKDPKDYNEDGTLKQTAINRSFTYASDAAMRSANTAVNVYGIDLSNDAALKLFSHFGYQSNPYKWFTYGWGKDIGEAIRNKDENAALQALSRTQPYKWAHDARKGFYINLVKKAVKNKP